MIEEASYNRKRSLPPPVQTPNFELFKWSNAAIAHCAWPACCSLALQPVTLQRYGDPGIEFFRKEHSTGTGQALLRVPFSSGKDSQGAIAA